MLVVRVSKLRVLHGKKCRLSYYGRVKRDKRLTVLSLCDGMSCGQISLEQAGFKVKRYFASEIKDFAIRVTKENYPNTVHIGDVNSVSYRDGVL